MTEIRESDHMKIEPFGTKMAANLSILLLDCLKWPIALRIRYIHSDVAKDFFGQSF